MPTSRQQLGKKGEIAVHEHVLCPRCNRARHLTALPTNFQCADMICRFCGFLAQVKAVTVVDGRLPERVLGAAWRPQHEQILAGIFHALFVACFDGEGNLLSIDYIPSHILSATPGVFQPRKPLRETARRAGWRGFYYNLGSLPSIGIQRVYAGRNKTAGMTATPAD
jgi:type II restriction enzyme